MVRSEGKGEEGRVRKTRGKGTASVPARIGLKLVLGGGSRFLFFFFSFGVGGRGVRAAGLLRALCRDIDWIHWLPLATPAGSGRQSCQPQVFSDQNKELARVDLIFWLNLNSTSTHLRADNS